MDVKDKNGIVIQKRETVLFENEEWTITAVNYDETICIESNMDNFTLTVNASDVERVSSF